MAEKSFMTVEEVAAELRVSKSKAYQIVRELNAELQKQGYLTVAGRVNATFFIKRSVTAIKRKGDDLNGCIQRQCYRNVAGNLSFHELERGAEADPETGICYEAGSTGVGA